jgi:hypothetical protein
LSARKPALICIRHQDENRANFLLHLATGKFDAPTGFAKQRPCADA